MAWELFEDGRSLGAVGDLKIKEGHQSYRRVRSFDAPDELVPGAKDPDEITFRAAKPVNIGRKHELRESPSNRTIRITVDRVQGGSVHALARP